MRRVIASLLVDCDKFRTCHDGFQGNEPNGSRQLTKVIS